MIERPLVHRVEVVLHLGGGWALAIALGLRLAFGYITEHNTWLLHSQLFTVPLMLAALIFCACTLPRALGYASTVLVGGGAWLLALSLLPCFRYGWPRGPLPQWLMWGALGLLVLAWLYRMVKLRRWFAVMRGHGFEWLNSWVVDKPLATRLLASSVMRGLGYQRQE
jgi:hypothetical protein